jgi:hypothetical protein
MCYWEFEELFHGSFPHHTEFLVGWDQAIFLLPFNKKQRRKKKRKPTSQDTGSSLKPNRGRITAQSSTCVMDKSQHLKSSDKRPQICMQYCHYKNNSIFPVILVAVCKQFFSFRNK